MNLVKGGGGFMMDEYHIKCAKAGGRVHAERMKNDEEYREKQKKTASENWKKAHRDGKMNYDTFTGKVHTEETKKLMSEAKKGQGIGKSNSQYGTCWITRDGENKKIKKQEIDSYLNEGWEKGRK